MCTANAAKSVICEITANYPVDGETFILHCTWTGPAPRAGQFFMIKPVRFSFFLPRPIGVFEFNPVQNTVKFLITRHGKGTQEFSQMQIGEKMQLTGPFGNAWADFLPDSGSAALVSGGAGIAPLAALVAEKPDYNFHFYAGFKTGFKEKEQEDAMLGAGKNAKKVIIAAEDGVNALSGRIVEYFFEPEKYDIIFSCGPFEMLKALLLKCNKKDVPCYVSMESRMACGAGACLGCTIRTTKGNRRCCSDGPIFSSKDLIINE
ncbi:MAG: dihydroorotate dehydrogenase electron transfer subunit [Treponema sp.]|jgi:NAD(P)H-flavin reductase|nr:dihydroorotate dehydrogenase electron transfer subunit [Treponema sp.]